MENYKSYWDFVGNKLRFCRQQLRKKYKKFFDFLNSRAKKIYERLDGNKKSASFEHVCKWKTRQISQLADFFGYVESFLYCFSSSKTIKRPITLKSTAREGVI